MAGDERRANIVDAAFESVAREGFEGLRTRDVAARVRINPATLHHYFATKEHLVAAVAERLAQRFATEKARRPTGEGALADLRAQFADVRFYQERRPDLVAVYRELAGRALRDAPTRALVDDLDAKWRRGVEDIIARGVEEGVFRPSLVPSTAATAVTAALWGAVALMRLSPSAVARMCVEIERGLLARES